MQLDHGDLLVIVPYSKYPNLQEPRNTTDLGCKHGDKTESASFSSLNSINEMRIENITTVAGLLQDDKRGLFPYCSIEFQRRDVN